MAQWLTKQALYYKRNQRRAAQNPGRIARITRKW
jgi:hypothetical protein